MRVLLKANVLKIGQLVNNILVCLVVCLLLFVFVPMTFTLISKRLASAAKEKRDGYSEAKIPDNWGLRVIKECLVMDSITRLCNLGRTEPGVGTSQHAR